jgi:putative PEP-CTERM system histidine kinase
LPFIVGVAAAFFAVALGVAAVFRRRHSFATWCFFGGMLVLATESILAILMQRVVDPVQADGLLTLALSVEALLPPLWIGFSLTYSRGNYGEFLRRWRCLLVAVLVIPVGIVIGFHSDLVTIVLTDSGALWWVRLETPARSLSVVVLLSAMLVLVNLERTARASVGMARWRIKYTFLGLGLIFGVKIYTASQALLFSNFNPSLAVVEAVALLIGCSLMSIAYLREGFGEIDIYPSHSVLRGSLTVLVVGCYLLTVGILAQVVTMLGGMASFPAQAFLVLLGVVGLAAMLLSDRFRTWIQYYVSRNFRRPEHDFRQVWTRFTERTFSVMDRDVLCREVTKLISETFDVLTVNLFLVDEDQGRFVPCISTFEGEVGKGIREEGVLFGPEAADFFREKAAAFDLRSAKGDWVDRLREANPVQFSHGGRRWAVPLVSGSRVLGLLVLADRVNGIPYTQEEQDLLACIADQFSAVLLNRQLAEEVMVVRELEAFQTMSTFFVHDLKNAANSLNLMLQNLPNHFDDPEFRKDALRAVGKSVARIDQMIIKLGALRRNLEIRPVAAGLNSLVEEVLAGLQAELEGVEVTCRLVPMEEVMIDVERMRSVLVNLLMNAREAIGSGGSIRVETSVDSGEVVIEVEDNGAGMTAKFIRDSLFRPFWSTKSKGLGIGLFQSKMIVEAHRGRIQVESHPAEGTVIRVLLPHS